MFIGSAAAGPSIHARIQVISSMNGLDAVHERTSQQRQCHALMLYSRLLVAKSSFFFLHTTRQGCAQQICMSPQYSWLLKRYKSTTFSSTIISSQQQLLLLQQ